MAGHCSRFRVNKNVRTEAVSSETFLVFSAEMSPETKSCLGPPTSFPPALQASFALGAAAVPFMVTVLHSSQFSLKQLFFEPF